MQEIRVIDNGRTFHVHAESIGEMKRRPVQAWGICGREDALLLDRSAVTGHERAGLGEPGTGYTWWGTKDRASTLAAIDGDGWESGIKKLRELMEQLSGEFHEAPRSQRRRKVWAEEGDHCDADRLLMGEYDRAFQTTKRRPNATNGRIIRIFGQIGGLSKVTSEQLFWSGAATVVLTDLLENSGFRVELYAANYGVAAYENPASNVLTTIRLKGASDSMNIDQFATTLCLAGFFRTYVFYARCAPSANHSSSGSTTTVSPELLAMSGLFSAGDMIVPLLRSRAEAIRWLREAVKQVDEPVELNLPAASSQPPRFPPRQNRAATALTGSKSSISEAPKPEPEMKQKLMSEAVPKVSRPRIVADGLTWEHRKTLGAYGFLWTRGSTTWVADDSDQARKLMEAGLPGVTFTVLQ